MVLGVGAITVTLHPILVNVLPYDRVVRKEPFKLHIPFYGQFELHLVDIIGGFLASVVAVIYFVTKHWTTNNIFGECFSIVSIQLIHLGSFKVGSILLTGLFFYDIFWVFGTDVMVTVAKSFDAPIKVIWPKSTGFSLLGLGDIVIPGIFIALMLRFDRYLARKKSKTHKSDLYFTVCFIGYVVGLLSTILVLHIFQAGQPALLYIVPCVILPVLLTAFIKGDVKELFIYHDDMNKAHNIR
jgi:minor histocompatibility antigen H13